MAALKANEAVLRDKLAAHLLYQQTPEYKSACAERERKREEHRLQWLAFAASGWPISRSLVRALNEEASS